MILAPSRDPLWRPDGPGRAVFHPNAGQRRFIESPAHEILFSGHWGNGKSIALIVKCWMLCLRYPGARGVLLRKIYADLRLSTLRHFRKVVGEREWKRGLVGGERPERFDFENGSSIDFIGVAGESGRSDKLLSTEYCFLAADECNELEEHDWEMGMGRLRQPGVPVHQAFGCCNPDHPQHWLHGRFRPDRGTNRQHDEQQCDACRGSGVLEQFVVDEATGEVALEPWACAACSGTGRARVLLRECIVAGLSENDENQPASYLAFKRSLKGTRGKRYREGKWTAFEGMVFEEWDPNVHLCDAPAEWAAWGGFPPPDWRRVDGIDFGFENPFVWERFAISPDDHWYRYRELYMTHRTAEKHADQIAAEDAAELEVLRERAKALGREREMADYLEQLNVTGRYCDHDRGERETLRDHGVWNDAANKEIGAGLQSVMNLLSPHAPGGPRLHFVRGAGIEEDDRLAGDPKRPPQCVEDEMAGYRWAKRRGGDLEGTSKDLPVDRDNHGIDAVRYAVHSELTRATVAAY